MKTRIGTVAQLWRYPVKSMRGESLNEMTLTERGTVGDRLFALRELKYGAIMSARMFASMLHLRATCERGPIDGAEFRVRIEFPQGTSIYADDPRADSMLSALFEHPVRLELPRGDVPLSMSEIQNIKEGRAFLPPRDLYDEDVLHLLASGTLDHLRRLCPADFDVRHFRPNVYIETDASDAFIEDGWLGGELQIGENAVRIVGIRPALRCAMTIHPQAELRADPAILRTAAQHHAAYVSVFASIGRPGQIRVGDSAWLVKE